MSSVADRNLLLGMLALQMNFVTREAIVAATQAWTLDRSRPLGQILVEQGALSTQRLALIEPLVEEHLRQHDGDPQRTLAAVGAAGLDLGELAALGDSPPAAMATRPRDAHDVERTILHERSSSTRFEILRPHAEGGLGEVFVAHDAELNREIALKEIHVRLAKDATSRQRFVQEAEITGRLEHPGIVPVYGLGQYPDGRPFYAMKFIRGETLKRAIERFHGSTYADSDSPATDRPVATASAQQSSTADLSSHSLEFRELLGRFVDVCNTIGYAHSRGVLHRDLKPSNIMLGNFGETLVVDWGLAKMLGAKELTATESCRASIADLITPNPSSGSAETIAGTAIGTPAFMSPEQAAGRLDDLGPTTDVYGLGATLYCLLTGIPPFSGGYVGETLERVQRGDFPAPRAVQPNAPRSLEAICLKAMAHKPSDRYPAARALAADVEHWLADEPVSAAREALAERLARWGRRHRALVASAAALLLASIMATAVGLIFLGREQARTERAESQAQAAAALADSQADVANSISGFLVGMFEEATPFEFFGMRLGNRELDPAARVLLDRGARGLSERLDQQPLVKAAMLAAIGRAHAGTGSMEKAAPLLEQALAIHRAELPPDDMRIADDMEILTLAYSLQDRTGEAQACARENLRMRRAAFDESNEAVLRAKVGLAILFGMTGTHLAEAERYWREVLEVRRKSLDPNDVRVAEALMGLGGTLLWEGSYNTARATPAEAIACMGDALKILSARPETREIGLAITSIDRALVLERLHFDQAATAAIDDALRRLKSTIGDHHPITAFVATGYPQILLHTGRQSDVKAVFHSVFAEYEEYGIRFAQPQMLSLTFDRILAALDETADQDAFEQALRRTLAKQKELTSYRSRNTVTLLETLVKLLKKRGQDDAAQILVDDYLATSNLMAETQSIFDAFHLSSVTDVLRRTRRLNDAATICRGYLRRLRSLSTTETNELSNTLLVLGNVLRLQRQFAEAETTLTEASDIARKDALDHKGLAWLFHAVAVERGASLDAWGRTSQAQEVLRDAIELGRKVEGSEFDRDHWALRLRRDLGLLLVREGSKEEAKAQFEFVLAAARSRSNLGDDASLVESAKEELAKLTPEGASEASAAPSDARER